MNALRQLSLSIVSLILLALAPVGAAWAQVKVTSATPAETSQGTVSLDVTIDGSGFDNTAKPRFLVTGTTDTGGITVKKVVVKSSRQLVATIDVADTAVVNKFDIEVTLDSGRKGKGTTLFAVLSKTNDPCAVAGTDFPAFAFVKGSGTTQQVYVANATGTCSKPLFTVTDGYSASTSLSFSYPVDGSVDRGRVVWREGTQVVGGDFTVSGTDVVVGSRQIFVTGVDCCALELSPTGDFLYVSTAQRTLSKVSVENPANRSVIKTLTDDGWFTTATSSGDESALYVEENRMQGTQPAERQLIRIDLADLASTLLVPDNVSQYWPAADPGSNRIAYTFYLVGSNNCYQLQIMDGTTGALISFGQPRYGTGATWVNGKILSNGYSEPSRRNKCAAIDKVTEVDPATGSETQIITGWAPDGR